MFPALRALLVADAIALLLLGLVLLFRPQQVSHALGFHDLPASADYLVGILGCLFVTTGLGYIAATRDPLRHLIWIQIGIARGTLEVLLGLVYIKQGAVTWSQAAPGLAAATVIVAGYVIFYPHPPKVELAPADTP